MSRKYGHRGYQDSDREERNSPRQAPRQELGFEERIQRKSMRKATERQAKEVMRCHSCGRNVPDIGTIAQNSTCPHCNAAFRCCRACAHFDSSSRWECRTEITEQVANKTTANACPSYRPRLVLDFTGRRGSTHRPNDAKSAFDDLFKR